MPDWKMKGQYLKGCNCLASCPCDTIGVPAPHNHCEGLIAMNIQDGHFDGVSLNGLKWVGVIHFPGAMHEGNGTCEYYIDERASSAQRNALQQILTGKAEGPLFEIVATVAPRLLGTHFVPISWEFDKDRRQAHLAIPGYVEMTTQPLRVIPTGDEQRVIVRMPGGFEYKEMEVAQATVLKSSGAIKYEWQNTHSSLAEVEQTPEGVAG